MLSGFVRHEHFDGVCAQASSADHVEYSAARCSGYDVLAKVVFADVLAKVCTADTSVTLHVHAVAQCEDNLRKNETF
jgi:hypothetical protein